MRILVLDVGGSNVKIHAVGWPESRRFVSGPDLTPEAMVDAVRPILASEKFDAISIGYPGEVRRVAPKAEPANLAEGWVGFDFDAAFGLPVRLINDAAMQALGGYTGGRMLFLGLGTGLGSALVSDRIVIPLEFGALRMLPTSRTLGEKLGKSGRKRLGLDRWRQLVLESATMLRQACAADYVLLGGGHAADVGALPDNIRRGHNDDAFTGGLRLWEEEVDVHAPRHAIWRVVK